MTIILSEILIFFNSIQLISMIFKSRANGNQMVFIRYIGLHFDVSRPCLLYNWASPKASKLSLKAKILRRIDASSIDLCPLVTIQRDGFLIADSGILFSRNLVHSLFRTITHKSAQIYISLHNSA
jgi:hypothetical protein